MANRTPPRMPFPYTVIESMDDVPDGGVRRPTLGEVARAPKFDRSRLIQSLPSLPPPPQSSPDWCATFAQNFILNEQGRSGPCTAATAASAISSCGLNINKGPALNYSWPFSHVTARNGALDVANGNSLEGPIRSAQEIGVCLDSFDPQAVALANIDSGLLPVPTAAAYADALKRKVLAYSYLPMGGIGARDPTVLMQVLNAGYPVPFGIGDHAMCLLSYTDQYWFWMVNSYPAGFRCINLTTLMAEMWDAIVVESVEIEGVEPPGHNDTKLREIVDNETAAINLLGAMQP